MEFIKVKKEELTSEQDAILRDYLVKMLMPYRNGRAIHSIIGEANTLYNCLFLLDEASFPDHSEINLPSYVKNILGGVQRNFLYCVMRVLDGRTHESIELLIADARHISSFIWKPEGSEHYLPIIDPYAQQ